MYAFMTVSMEVEYADRAGHRFVRFVSGPAAQTRLPVSGEQTELLSTVAHFF